MHSQYRHPEIIQELAPFKMEGRVFHYAEFVPRLYNYCMELGFRKGFIMPSRAFCSDENQGLPIILLTNHFGTFPFNHGRVGGIIAVDRHAPHAHHGEDLVIVQASHVGYNPNTGVFGEYIRPKRLGTCVTDSCGKLIHVITPYLLQYQFAKERIFLHRDDLGRHVVTVKNAFIDFSSKPVKDGLVLRLQAIAKAGENGTIRPLAIHSTSHTFEITETFRQHMDDTNYQWRSDKREAIGNFLTSDLFYFREDFHETDESILLERNLIEFMPKIVTADHPALLAAQINVQLEFARTIESIHRGNEYTEKNLLYIAGLNIDLSGDGISPPTTYFVPWAAHVQLTQENSSDYCHPVEQDTIFRKLMKQSIENPDQIDLKKQITRMLDDPGFHFRSSDQQGL